MRVRLYEVGTSTVGVVLRFDEFPVRLAIDETGGLMCAPETRRPAFCIDESGGQLLFEATDSERAPLVNDAALDHGALMPGDRLAVKNRQFIVSYERTANAADPPPARYRIQAAV